MAWCMQCGSAGTPELAMGVDEDGEPACAIHRIREPGEMTLAETARRLKAAVSKPAKFATATSAPSPQPAVQKREEAVMGTQSSGVRPTTTCVECGKKLAQFMLDRHIKAKHGVETPKLSVAIAPLRVSGEDVMKLHGFSGQGSVALLKADLQQKLAQVEAVEAMLLHMGL